MKPLAALLALCLAGCSMSYVTATDGDYSTKVLAFATTVNSERTTADGASVIVTTAPMGPRDDMSMSRKDLPDGGIEVTQEVRADKGVIAGMLGNVIAAVIGFFVGGGGV